MENSNELWLPVKGYESYYEVSNYGNVRSLARSSKHWRSGYQRMVYGKLLIKQVAKRGGYHTVHLKISGKRKNCKVHRLVAEAWLSNTYNKPFINHKDGNKINNSIKNLEWCTHQENVNHAVANGLRPKIVRTKKWKSVLAYNKNGDFIKEYTSIRDAARELNVFGQNICSVLSGRQKWVKGYTFKPVANELS